MSAMTVGGSLAAMWAASAGLRIPSLPETGRSPQGPYTKYSPFLTHGPGVAFSASARRARRDPVVQSFFIISFTPNRLAFPYLSGRRSLHRTLP